MADNTNLPPGLDLAPPRTGVNIPASKCPTCGHLHRFDDFDFSDAGPGYKYMGHGAVLICQGPDCAEVLQLARNLTLEVCDDARLRYNPAVTTERRDVCDQKQIDYPPDIDLPDVLPIHPTPPPVNDIAVMAVWPTTDSPIPYGYCVSVTGTRVLPGVELVATGCGPPEADVLFSVAAGILEASPLDGTMIDTGTGYQLAFAHIPRPTLDALALDPEVDYVQVVWQDHAGRWPWDPDTESGPVIAGTSWRPQGIDAPVDVTEVPPATD